MSEQDTQQDIDVRISAPFDVPLAGEPTRSGQSIWLMEIEGVPSIQDDWETGIGASAHTSVTMAMRHLRVWFDDDKIDRIIWYQGAINRRFFTGYLCHEPTTEERMTWDDVEHCITIWADRIDAEFVQEAAA